LKIYKDAFLILNWQIKKKIKKVNFIKTEGNNYTVWWVKVMVFNTTFNISVISWQSVLNGNTNLSVGSKN
jgi:hypothetical protein